MHCPEHEFNHTCTHDYAAEDAKIRTKQESYNKIKRDDVPPHICVICDGELDGKSIRANCCKRNYHGVCALRWSVDHNSPDLHKECENGTRCFICHTRETGHI